MSFRPMAPPIPFVPRQAPRQQKPYVTASAPVSAPAPTLPGMQYDAPEGSAPPTAQVPPQKVPPPTGPAGPWMETSGMPPGPMTLGQAPIEPRPRNPNPNRGIMPHTGQFPNLPRGVNGNLMPLRGQHPQPSQVAGVPRPMPVPPTGGTGPMQPPGQPLDLQALAQRRMGNSQIQGQRQFLRGGAY